MIILNVQQRTDAWFAAKLGLVSASKASEIITTGGEPKMPTYYQRVAGAEPPSARAKRQTEAWNFLGNGRWPLAAQVAKPLLASGRIEVCEPPEGAEPIRKAPERSEQSEKYLCALVAEWIRGLPDDPHWSNEDTEHGNEHEGQARAYFSVVTGLTSRPAGLIYRDAARDVGCSPDGLIYDERGDIVAGHEIKCPRLSTLLRWGRAGGVPLEHVLQLQFSLWVTGLPAWYFQAFHPQPNVQGVLVRVEPDDVYQAAFDEHVSAFLVDLHHERGRQLADGVVPRLPDLHAEIGIESGTLPEAVAATD